MRVVELWRYPVKSLQGERLDAAALTAGGVEGDRRFAIFDRETRLGLTARRVPELLFAEARLIDLDTVEITLPDGSIAHDDRALSAWLGRPVTLRSADNDIQRRYENPADFEHETTGEWTAFEGPGGPFHDSAAVRISLLSTGTIGSWDRRRFRPNILLHGAGEDLLVGSTVALGGALLEIGVHIQRCVMTTRPQPGGIERDVNVLRTIARERNAQLAVGALVTRTGILRVGDELRDLTGSAGPLPSSACAAAPGPQSRLP